MRSSASLNFSLDIVILWTLGHLHQLPSLSIRIACCFVSITEAEEVPKKEKRVQYVLEESSESESEEEIVYVQRKRPAKKQVKKQPRVVYVSDSSDEEEYVEPQEMTSMYSFV